MLLCVKTLNASDERCTFLESPTRASLQRWDTSTIPYYEYLVSYTILSDVLCLMSAIELILPGLPAMNPKGTISINC